MKTETQNFSWLSVVKSVWYFLEKDKKKFILYFSILPIVLFYNLVPPYVVGKIIDFFTTYSIGDSLENFYLYVAFLGITYIVVSMVRLHCKKQIIVLGPKCRTNARIWGFERLTDFSLEWHKKENTGDKLQRIFTGADSVKSCFDILSEKLTNVFINTIGALTVFFFVDIKLFILIICYIVVYVLIEFDISKKLFLLSNQFNQLNQSAGGVYVESATNILSIKALGGGSGANVRVTNKEEKSRDVAIEKQRVFYNKWIIFQFINGSVMAFFLLVTGLGVVNGTVTIGLILAFFSYFLKLMNNLGDVSDLHTTLLDIRSGISQMMPIFKETEFVKTGNESFPKDWQKIEIKNGVMHYGSGQIGLNGLNLVLNKNTKTGIAGLSGSGKSTLAKIILGLYGLQSGEFKIGNKSYYSISHNETLSNLTVVLQETELFNLSLRDNITMMRGADEDLLKMAVRVAELEEVIQKLPQGLDSLIGEKGYTLSGGERQRLGIARAVYKNAPIVILDEATSSLDSETEGKVMQKLLGEYGKDRTFLIIAHRLGTLKYTDRIAVMESGKIVEEGSYDHLMSDSSSLFYRMNQEQKVKS